MIWYKDVAFVARRGSFRWNVWRHRAGLVERARRYRAGLFENVALVLRTRAPCGAWPHWNVPRALANGMRNCLLFHFFFAATNNTFSYYFITNSLLTRYFLKHCPPVRIDIFCFVWNVLSRKVTSVSLSFNSIKYAIWIFISLVKIAKQI